MVKIQGRSRSFGPEVIVRISNTNSSGIGIEHVSIQSHIFVCSVIPSQRSFDCKVHGREQFRTRTTKCNVHVYVTFTVISTISREYMCTTDRRWPWSKTSEESIRKHVGLWLGFSAKGRCGTRKSSSAPAHFAIYQHWQGLIPSSSHPEVFLHVVVSSQSVAYMYCHN